MYLINYIIHSMKCHFLIKRHFPYEKIPNFRRLDMSYYQN